MKKTIGSSYAINSAIYNSLLKNLIILIIPFILFSQDNYEFGSSIRVNDDPAASSYHGIRSSGQHGLACRGDTVYVVFADERNGGSERAIYFSKSTDAGQTWNPNLRIDGALPGFQTLWASIALDAQGGIYVTFWADESGSDANVYFVKSTDGGASFSAPVLVNDTTRSIQWRPSIAVDSSGQKVFIVWEDARNPVDPPNYDIYFARSTDGGLTFLPSIRVDDTGADSSWQQVPSVGCTRSGDTICVAWRDERNPTRAIYFSRSTDGGQTFEADALVNDTAAIVPNSQRDPSLWMSKSGNVYIVWEDLRLGTSEIYFDKSTDGGFSFGQDVKVTDDTAGGRGNCGTTCDDSERIYVSWQDSRDFSTTGYDIYFSFSNDSGSTFSADVRVNDLGGIVDAWDWNANVAVNSDGTVFVAWDSDRNDPGGDLEDIYCATGRYVGIEEITSTFSNKAIVQVFPNPFRKTVHIRLQNTELGDNTFLKIYDISGRCVKTLTHHSSDYIIWTGADDAGKVLPAGVYFCRLQTGEMICIRKLIKVE